MKKFTKISLIIAGGLLTAGLGFMISGVVIAGGAGVLISELRNGKWNFGNLHFEDGIYYKGDTKVDVTGIVNESLGLLQGGKEELTEIFEEELTRLEVEADLANIEIKTGDIQDVTVNLKEGHLIYYEAETDGDTLCVRYEVGAKNITKGPEIIIEVPQHMDFETVSVHTNLGEIEINGLHSDSMYLYSDLGNIDCSGEVRVMQAETTMGNIEAALIGEEKHYSIDLSTDFGTIEYNGEKIPEEIYCKFTSYHHHSTESIILHSSMGNVELDFTKR